MLRVAKLWDYRIMRHLSTEVSPSASLFLKSYEEAVRTLNTLQSNAVTIEKARLERDAKRPYQIPQTIQMAARAGVTLSDIDKLSIIHVSGTKGKGSTCAFCESILRNHGYKTGFFSSPHLVEVRERIRINGRPLSKDVFSTYFWECYKNLADTKEAHGGEMPAYFRFLTIMAFHVFLQEQVDVAIMEVGIGGQYDCTNIIRHPVVVGVSSLGLDHMKILGNTIEKIAWQKAGIFKTGVPAVTVPQPPSALEVLRSRALEIGNPLSVCPSYESYDWDSQMAALGIAGEVQKTNASLAMQLCHVWIQNHGLDRESRQSLYSDQVVAARELDSPVLTAETFPVSKELYRGLESCRWAGRTQMLERPGVTYFLDGAHTDESIEQCSQWFVSAADEERERKPGKRVARILLFNVTGDRDPTSLMLHLKLCGFDAAVFCPNIASMSASKTRADQCNFMVTPDSQLSRSFKCRTSWLQVLSSHNPPPSHSATDPPTKLDQTGEKNKGFETLLEQKLNRFVSTSNPPDSDSKQETQREEVVTGNRGNSSEDSGVSSSVDVSARCTPDHDAMPCFVFSSIQEVLQWVTRCTPVANGDQDGFEPLPAELKDLDHVQVLCTGSLHLVGGVIGLLEPDFSSKLNAGPSGDR